MGRLLDYAKKELGLYPTKDDCQGDSMNRAVLELVKVFEKQGHSGFSARVTLATFMRVASFKPLGPLTSDPKEWMEVGDARPGVVTWQNRRHPSVFSYDRGKTWYDIDEKGGRAKGRRQLRAAMRRAAEKRKKKAAP